VYEHESRYAGRAAVTRHLTGRRVDGALVFTIPPALRRSPLFGPATLVVANGDPNRPGVYSVAVARAGTAARRPRAESAITSSRAG
jgi:hypothetical protein